MKKQKPTSQKQASQTPHSETTQEVSCETCIHMNQHVTKHPCNSCNIASFTNFKRSKEEEEAPQVTKPQGGTS